MPYYATTHSTTPAMPTTPTTGCLLTYLRINKPQILDRTQILLYMTQQVCAGMAYLESKHFIHRDLVSWYMTDRCKGAIQPLPPPILPPSPATVANSAIEIADGHIHNTVNVCQDGLSLTSLFIGTWWVDTWKTGGRGQLYHPLLSPSTVVNSGIEIADDHIDIWQHSKCVPGWSN